MIAKPVHETSSGGGEQFGGRSRLGISQSECPLPLRGTAVIMFSISSSIINNTFVLSLSVLLLLLLLLLLLPLLRVTVIMRAAASGSAGGRTSESASARLRRRRGT